MPEISETPKSSFTKFFSTVRQKIFDGKTWYSLLCIKFFDTPNFLKHWRDAHEIFRHCDTKNFRRKNVIPPPFSSIKLFQTRSFFINCRIPSRKHSALWDRKILTENRNMPPLIHKFFWIPEIFRKTEGILYKVFRFGPVRQKISTKPWCPLLCMKIFDKRIFLKHQNGLQWNILVQWDKNFSTEKRDTPHPLIHRIFFPIRNFLKYIMVPWRIFFGLVSWNNFRQNREASPLFCLKIFVTRILSKHRRVLLRILSALWDKDFSTEFSDIPFFCIKFCDTRNFLKHRSVPQRNFLVLCDKKISTKKRDTPFLSDALNFSIPDIFW